MNEMQAFPHRVGEFEHTKEVIDHLGMTLRDYFAGQALIMTNVDEGGTVASAAKELGIDVKEYNCHIHWPQIISKRCYAMADAMLKEREERDAK